MHGCFFRHSFTMFWSISSDLHCNQFKNMSHVPKELEDFEIIGDLILIAFLI